MPGAVQSGEEYTTLFGRLITDWREKWAIGNFPFLYVQLASYRHSCHHPFARFLALFA